MILVGSVELDSEFLQDSSIINPSCDISEVTSPVTHGPPTGFIRHCSMTATCPSSVTLNPLKANSIPSVSHISPNYSAGYLNFAHSFRKTKTDCLHKNMTQDAIHY